ncbi:MAG: 5'-nucleotidase, lipoprotein e(P4) family [Flavisolibacter sp.]
MKKYFLIALLAFTACSTTKNLPQQTSGKAIADGKLFASLFQQQAAEYKALCFQAFNFARLKIDQHSQLNTGLPKAIITDIDETILDNSAYDVHQVLQGKDYEPASWSDWTSRGIADTVPGAPHFLHYAASKGVTIFYITNRNEEERAGTLKNLQRFNLPNADNAHLILKKGVSSKEPRRQEIMKNYDVVLLMGDNLADFSELYDKRTVEDRNLVTRQLAAEFGHRFIMLPNPVYGDWESALYQYNSKLTMAQKDSIIRKTVKGY